MKPESIVIHHSLTKDSSTVSWGNIRRYHLSWAYKGNIITSDAAQNLLAENRRGVKRPWRDIGYHFGIELANVSYEILLGRMPNVQGAHAGRGGNTNSLGVCFVGNFDKIEPPEPMWEKGLVLVRWLMDNYGITKDHIMGHRDIATYKTCPGLKFDMMKFKDEL